MKKLYILFLITCSSLVNAQTVNITDPVLKTRLLSPAYNSYYIAKDASEVEIKIDANSNGEIEVAEAMVVRKLELRSVQGISSFDGLNSFANVTELTFSISNAASVNVNVDGFPLLQTLYFFNLTLNSITLNNLPNLTFFRCVNINTASVNATEGLPNLETFIWECADPLVTFNTVGFSSVKEVQVKGATINHIQFSHFPNVETLTILEGTLPNIIFSQHPLLKFFTGQSAGSTSYDFSANPLIEEINVHAANIASINVNGCSALRRFSCFESQLVSLDLSNKPLLESVAVQNNLLTSINISNCPSLDFLNVNNNMLSSLDVSTSLALKILYCNINQLTSLDLANHQLLTSIEAYTNQLATVNFNNCTSLDYVDIRYNNLSLLDFSSCVSLNYYQIAGNPNLTHLLIKNNTQAELTAAYNTSLSYVCVDEDRVDSYKAALILYGYLNAEVNSYCSFNPGGVFYTANGISRFDAQANGCDIEDSYFGNLKFEITNWTYSGTSIGDISGNYSIPVGNGAHTITPALENPSYFNVSPASVTVNFPAQTSPQTNNFCITANGVHPDAEVVIIPLIAAVPGFDVTYKLVYKNKGSVTLNNGVVGMTYNDAVLDFISANGSGQYFEPNIVGWSYTNLQPFETREILVTFNLNSPMETPAVDSGYHLLYNAFISTENDESPQDNAMHLDQIVVNAMDPNDKTCLEGATITPEMVGKYVHYLIRFENLGTAPAQNVVVKDMIDTAKFDINTLVPLDASHPFETRISNTNKVEFIFEGINLPFDNATNDGYIAFKIKTKPTLALEDTFSNTASIYFDYNFPVITDPAVTTVALLGNETVDLTKVKLYPNPVDNVLNIEGVAGELKSVSVYNLLGQLILVVPNANELNTVDVSSLSAGNYLIKMQTNTGTAVTKFIKR